VCACQRWRYPRFVPVTTISTRRLSRREQTSRSRQSSTCVPAPSRSASWAGSGSICRPQRLHHTISRGSAFAAPSSAIGGPGWDFTKLIKAAARPGWKEFVRIVDPHERYTVLICAVHCEPKIGLYGIAGLALVNCHSARLANALGVELIAAEAARSTEHPDALDYILRGRAILLKPRTRDTYRDAINSFEHALALDPQSVEAQSRLAAVLVVRVLNGVADSSTADLARAETLVDQVLAASSRNAFAHYVKGHVLLALKRWEEAIPEYEAALALDHNLVAALHGLAWCKLYAGSIGEVTPLVEQAIRLSPRDPGIGHCYDLIGTAGGEPVSQVLGAGRGMIGG